MIIYSATPTVGIKKGSLRIEKRDVSFMIRIINDTKLFFIPTVVYGGVNNY